MQQATIFDIKRYAINDGPGIRVTYFLKGCPLQCAWCHNPESISPGVQKMFNQAKCIGCGECLKVCPENAISMTAEGLTTDRDRCTSCGKCADICPSKAIEMSGRSMGIDEMLAIAEKERHFFDQSDGGITFSGGEPLAQFEFLHQALQAFGSRGFHRSIDTTGLTSSERLLKIAEHTDLFLYDLKVFDSEQHRKWTGVPNETILDNLKLLTDSGAAVNIRIPFIKGVNSDDDNLDRSAAFIASLERTSVKAISLLPYHNIMVNKHLRLGTSFDPADMQEPTPEDIDRATEHFARYGLRFNVGG